MRKCKIYALGFFLIGVLAMSSCSDEKNAFINVGKENQTGIECSNLDQIVEIPVESNGNWTASLPEDCDWITILTNEGNNNGVIRLVVGLNSASENYTPIRRSTTLTVKCGDQTSTIGLTQFVGASADEPGGNSNEGGKGLGKGFDISAGRPLNPIFNINIISRSDNDEIKYSFVTQPVAEQVLDSHEFDSLESKRDSLGVSLKILVSYGSFKLNLEGAYSSYEKMESANFKYGQVAVLPLQEANLHVIDLVALAEEDATLCNSIYSPGFRNIRRKIITDFEAGNMDKFKAGIQSLLEVYGPVVTTEMVFGGQVSMYVQVDTTKIEDTMNIKGMASMAFKAMVEIEGEVNAGYLKTGTAILRKSKISSYVQGGSRQAISDISYALQKASKTLDAADIREKMIEWERSVVYSDKQEINTTEPLEYGFTGIWNLFPYDIMGEIRKVVIESYKGKESMLDIKKFQLRPKTKVN